MGHRGNHLLPLLIDVETQIQMDPDKLDLHAILETQQKLYTIITQLNIVRNSRTPINKLPPDILYNIFTYTMLRFDPDKNNRATRNEDRSMEAALIISHVCHHWRNFALEWPKLWRFIDLNDTREIIELFLRRSKNTPLHLHSASSDKTRMEPNLKFCANTISPRLHYLTLRLSLSQLVRIQSSFHNPELQPLQLQYLQMVVMESYIGSLTAVPLLTDLIRLDMDCLRSLSLQRVDLPWLKLPHNNVLTRFIFRSNHLPILPRFLEFLSSCHLLCELELDLPFISYIPETSALTTSRLDFPKLEQLLFKTHSDYEYSFPNNSTFNYIRELSTRIGTMGLLSCFTLHTEYMYHLETSADLSPFNMFDLVPKETFSHFSNQNYLSIYFDSTNYSILSTPEWPDSEFHSKFSLIGTLAWGPGQPFGDCLFELISAMPKISHLKLNSGAVESLISRNLNFPNAFPCLNTLELYAYSIPLDETLNSLKLSLNLMNLKGLILNFWTLSPQVLLDAVQRARVKVLELSYQYWKEFNDLEAVISTLRQTGIVIIITTD